MHFNQLGLMAINMYSLKTLYGTTWTPLDPWLKRVPISTLDHISKRQRGDQVVVASVAEDVWPLETDRPKSWETSDQWTSRIYISQSPSGFLRLPLVRIAAPSFLSSLRIAEKILHRDSVNRDQFCIVIGRWHSRGHYIAHFARPQRQHTVRRYQP
jgi:hypothetical protein